MGMNVVQDFGKVPTSMPKEGQVEADEDEKGGEEKLRGEQGKREGAYGKRRSGR